MTIVRLMLAAALAAGTAACSGGNDCTPEMINKKSQELTAAIQQKVTSDPASGQELMKRFQEVGMKFQNATDKSQACTAYDELLKSMKK